MNTLYPGWLTRMAATNSGPAFTTSPGPGSPGGTPGPAPAPATPAAPAPAQTQQTRYNPPFFEWPSPFYSPYDPYNPYNRYNAYTPYRPYREYIPVRRAAVGVAQARRLLDLAERAERVVDDAVRRGEESGASRRDRAAADEVNACMDDLTRDAGRFGRILAELRTAVDSGRPADLDLGQVSALETFAECADRAEDRRRA